MNEFEDPLPSSPNAGKPQSLDDVHSSHAGKWVLLRVTSFDKAHSPAFGHVMAKGPQKRVYEKLFDLLNAGDREGPYYVFHAYPRGRSGEALKAAVGEALKRGDVGAGRVW